MPGASEFGVPGVGSIGGFWNPPSTAYTCTVRAAGDAAAAEAEADGLSTGDAAADEEADGLSMPVDGTADAAGDAVPVPARAEVLVRIDAVAICATDLEIIYHGPPASFLGGLPFNKNFTPGHEYMGTVVALGPGVDERRGLSG